MGEIIVRSSKGMLYNSTKTYLRNIFHVQVTASTFCIFIQCSQCFVHFLPQFLFGLNNYNTLNLSNETKDQFKWFHIKAIFELQNSNFIFKFNSINKYSIDLQFSSARRAPLEQHMGWSHEVVLQLNYIMAVICY